MLKVDFSIGNWEKELLDSCNAKLEEALKGMRCTIHYKCPQLVTKLTKLETSNLKVDFCCEDFEKEAMPKINALKL